MDWGHCHCLIQIDTYILISKKKKKRFYNDMYLLLDVRRRYKKSFGLRILTIQVLTLCHNALECKIFVNNWPPPSVPQLMLNALPMLY